MSSARESVTDKEPIRFPACAPVNMRCEQSRWASLSVCGERNGEYENEHAKRHGIKSECFVALPMHPIIYPTFYVGWGGVYLPCSLVGWAGVARIVIQEKDHEGQAIAYGCICRRPPLRSNSARARGKHSQDLRACLGDHGLAQHRHCRRQPGDRS